MIPAVGFLYFPSAYDEKYIWNSFSRVGVRRILQTKTVTQQALENQYMYM